MLEAMTVAQTTRLHRLVVAGALVHAATVEHDIDGANIGMTVDFADGSRLVCDRDGRGSDAGPGPAREHSVRVGA